MDDMDKECIALCNAINLFSPDVHTIESCCGHGERHFCVWFTVSNFKVLPRILYYFDPCHNGFYEEKTSRAYTHRSWQVKVITDCAMSYPTFLVEGPIGEQAYQQAAELAELITEEFYRERDDAGQ